MTFHWRLVCFAYTRTFIFLIGLMLAGCGTTVSTRNVSDRALFLGHYIRANDPLIEETLKLDNTIFAPEELQFNTALAMATWVKSSQLEDYRRLLERHVAKAPNHALALFELSLLKQSSSEPITPELEKSASLGYVPAQMTLARKIYANRRTVFELGNAKEWLDIAIRNGMRYDLMVKRRSVDPDRDVPVQIISVNTFRKKVDRSIAAANARAAAAVDEWLADYDGEYGFPDEGGDVGGITNSSASSLGASARSTQISQQIDQRYRSGGCVYIYCQQ